MATQRVARVVLALALAGAAVFSGALAGTQKLDPLTIQHALRTSGQPTSIAIDANRGRAYVTDIQENTLYVFDLATDAVLAHIETGLRPVQVILAADRAFVSNFADRSITVIDTLANRPLKTLSVGGLGLAFDDKTQRLYVASVSRILVVDVVTDTIVDTLAAPPGANVWGLALDSASSQLFATDIANPRMLAFSTATGAVVSVPLDGPARFGITARGGRIAVASYVESSNVSMIDATTLTLLSRTSSGRFPWSVALDAPGVAYVTSPTNRTLSAVDLTGRTVSRADFRDVPGATAVHPLSGDVIAATTGGTAPRARPFGDIVPVVKP